MKTVITRFDMDYTLCEYISPQFDALACSLAIDHLVEVGFIIMVVFVITIIIMVIIHILLTVDQVQNYPAAIKELTYDPQFAVRGLWYVFPGFDQ